MIVSQPLDLFLSLPVLLFTRSFLSLSPHARLQRVMDEVMSVWRLQLLQRNNDSELMLIRKKEDANITRARASFPLITLLIYLSARELSLSAASQEVSKTKTRERVQGLRHLMWNFYDRKHLVINCYYKVTRAKWQHLCQEYFSLIFDQWE